MLLVVWIGVAAAGIFFWSELNFFVKAVLIVCGYFFCPTVDTIEQLLMSYDDYLKGGLW